LQAKFCRKGEQFGTVVRAGRAVWNQEEAATRESAS